MVCLSNRVLMFVALTAVLYGVPASSQAQDGRISGVVRDASGATVPGVIVTVTNQATGTSKTANTPPDGTYAVTGLPAGAYTVTADLPGFRRVILKDRQLTVGGTLTADVTLEAQLLAEVNPCLLRVLPRCWYYLNSEGFCLECNPSKNHLFVFLLNRFPIKRLNS